MMLVGWSLCKWLFWDVGDWRLITLCWNRSPISQTCQQHTLPATSVTHIDFFILNQSVDFITIKENNIINSADTAKLNQDIRTANCTMFNKIILWKFLFILNSTKRLPVTNVRVTNTQMVIVMSVIISLLKK